MGGAMALARAPLAPFLATAPGNASPAKYGMSSQLNSTEAKDLPQQQTVMIFCRAKPEWALTVVDVDQRVRCDSHVALAPANAANAMYNAKQQWKKDDHWGVTIKDYEGRPAFAIVNTVTGEAIQHPDVVGGQVRLVPYNPVVPDKSVLWTEEEAGQDLGFCYIRELQDVINPLLVGDPKVLDVVNDRRRIVFKITNGPGSQAGRDGRAFESSRQIGPIKITNGPGSQGGPDGPNGPGSQAGRAGRAFECSRQIGPIKIAQPPERIGVSTRNRDPSQHWKIQRGVL